MRATVNNFINILFARFSYKNALFPKPFRQSQNVFREKLCKALLYEKRQHKMLMKLPPVQKYSEWLDFDLSCQPYIDQLINCKHISAES